MIRALHVINSLAPAGAETLVLQLCRRLPEQGVSPVVASLFGPGDLTPLFEKQGTPVVNLGCNGRPDVLAVFELMAALRRHRIDVVHTHLAYAGVVGKVAARLLGLPVVTTRHYTTDPKIGTLPYRLEDFLIRRIARRLICISDYMKEIVLAQGLITPERVLVHRNAIDVEAFRRRSRERPSLRAFREREHDDGILVVGTVGRLEPQKAHEVFLKAMARLRERFPSVRGVILGEGRRRAELEALRSGLGLDDVVEMPGTIPPTEMPGFLEGIHVFAFSSDWEGLPLVVIEAMAMGVPVAATDVPAVSEVVREGETDYLVPPQNPDALAEAIARLLDDPDTRRRFGDNARAVAEAEFDVSRLARQTADLYHEICGERGRRFSTRR